MPRNREDVETFLLRLNRTFEESEGGTFVVASSSGTPPIALRVDEPIVVARADIGRVPNDTGRQLKLFRRLLELNANDLIHAAYGIEGDEIVLTAGLELENVDMNELAAVLSDIDVALARHVPVLRELAAG